MTEAQALMEIASAIRTFTTVVVIMALLFLFFK
jgi:hypothetical protein